MRALPVDVVRALLAIVDCRGFTRAAERLGRTQPTISLQIKRLEELIGGPAFDNTARLILSARGRMVVEHGRKFIAAHDELAEALRRSESAAQSVRLGMPNEFAPMLAPGLVGLAHSGGVSLAFEVTCEQSETLIDRVRARELDMALAMTALRAADSVAHWTMPLSWIAAPGMAFEEGPIRLVTPPEGTLFYNIAADALARAGRPFEIVCKSGNPDVLRGAVDAGYGVSLAPVALAPKGSRRLPDTLLAPLPDVTLGLYACEGEATDGPLVSRMIDMLQASPAFDKG